MRRTLSRQALFDKVWAEPLRDVAASFGISDVALAKVCRHHSIPVPWRGYWAKRQAGKRLEVPRLPSRDLGMTDTVSIGRGHWNDRQDEASVVAEEIPPPPEFPESLPDLTTRVQALVGKVPQTRDLKQPHPVIARLLKEDEARWEKWRASSYPSSFDRPFFASPFEQRRLRLLDAIFKATTRLGMRPSTHGRNPDRFHIRVGEVSVTFSLDVPKAPERSNYSTPSDIRRPASEPLRLQIHENYRTSDGVKRTWDDATEKSLERCLADIVVGILIAGEMMVRAGMLRAHTDRVEHKAYVIREIQHRKEEAIRKEQERQARIEQASIDKLMDDAAVLRMAMDIRAYVEAVRAANRESPEPVSEDRMSEWASWALLQAERIDPVRSRAFLEPVEDPGEPGANSKSRCNSRSEDEAQVQRPWHPNQKWYMR
jgi:hypothetical protein